MVGLPVVRSESIVGTLDIRIDSDVKLYMHRRIGEAMHVKFDVCIGSHIVFAFICLICKLFDPISHRFL